MESPALRGSDLDDDAFKQQAKAGTLPGAYLNMAGVGEDDEAAGDSAPSSNASR